MSRIVDVAEAIKTSINDASFSLSFTSKVEFRVETDLSKLNSLKVSVVPRSTKSELESRVVVSHEIQVDVGIQKKLQTKGEIGVPALMDLVQEIEDHIRNARTLPGGIAWVETVNDPVFSQEHMADHQFLSVLTFTMRVHGG